jgi:flagellin
MSLRIQTNVAAMNAHRQLTISDTAMGKSLERLSSGFRINRAADDAAGLAISSSLSSQVRSLTVASRNTSQATSLLQVAEGGMDQINNILGRLKELATQAASANNSGSLTDINNEATSLLAEIDRIANSTAFNGDVLLTGYGTKTAANTLTASNAYDLDVSGAAGHVYSVTYSVAAASTITIKDLTTSVSQNLTALAAGGTYDFSQFGISFKTTSGDAQSTILGGVATDFATSFSVNTADKTFQVGEENTGNHQITFQIDDVQKAALSVGGIALNSIGNAQNALTSIDNAIKALASSRADIGAIQNRLGYTYANVSVSIENLSAANSVIKDVDMASEMTEFTKNQILLQAGTAMLAQANMAPQSMLSLFG